MEGVSRVGMEVPFISSDSIKWVEASVPDALISGSGSGSRSIAPSTQDCASCSLEKYIGFHGRLPGVVADTLLRSDSQIELPLWLVSMFKGGKREFKWLTGQELCSATIFRLYVDYGRYSEATKLLVEYKEVYASMRPSGVIHRKRPFATWFPYTAIERHLEESIRAGHMID